MKKFIITFSVLLFAVVVPYLEINATHVFNLDWTPHARIHEVWQLITNSSIGVVCLWLVWVKKDTKISTILSLLITGSFLVAYMIQDSYGGSMKYLDGSENRLLGINMGVLVFGVVFIGLLFSLLMNKSPVQKP